MSTVWPPGWILLAPLLVAISFLVFTPPILQDRAYNLFADRRTLLGIPNFWNVVSNLPFAMVGILGLRTKRISSLVLFSGVLLTTFGSAYYHLSPNNSTLVWDRLPMTLVFMPLLAMVVGEWLDGRWEQRLLWPLVAFGVGSVAWWRYTRDLRPYALAQFGIILVLPAAFVFADRMRGLLPAAGLYVLAKLAEQFDRLVYRYFPLSGHTLKHLLAAGATYFIWRWVVKR